MIGFQEAKNGERTVSCDGKFLHSKYNPSSEGEKFAQNVQADFSPLCLIFIEPALAYSAFFLKKRFPRTQFIAIRFFTEFDKTENARLFDRTIFFDENTNLADELFECLSEEELCSALVLEWTPTKNLLPEKNALVWNEIKAAILKSRDVLGTRSYFSKRWLKNSISFFTNINTFCTARKTKLPIVVASSGRSLESSLPFLCELRQSYFLIAVSSAFLPLITHNIVPDIVISTDGGYWAKKHLAFPTGHKSLSTPVFALSSESAVPKRLLQNEKIIPLCYDDDEIQRQLFLSLGIPHMPARRNGTVSGTAVELALTLTDRTVYCVGLDQAPAVGYQHTQPNSLEQSSQAADFRLKPKETRLTSSQFSSAGSLAIYRNWFISKSRTRLSRVKRLSASYPFAFSLGAIKDVDWAFFKDTESDGHSAHADFSPLSLAEKSSLERKKILSAALEKIRMTDNFKKEFFPMERLLILRETDEEKKKVLKRELEEKISAFLKDYT
ncbi:MAG: DUF115 domain-containing protein [Treponema sp.]|nr:DUF115 domain-containing protein [Treponema sp.]